MLDSGLQVIALIPTRLHDNKISMPQVRRSLVVQKRRQRSHTTLPLWTAPIPVSRTTGRNYDSVLRGAGSRCDSTIEGNQDLQVPAGSEKRLPGRNYDWGHSVTNWIAGQGNGIASRHTDGQGTAGACECKEGSSRRLNLATDDSRKRFIRN